MNTRTGERSRDLPSETDDDSTYSTHALHLHSSSQSESLNLGFNSVHDDANGIENLMIYPNIPRQEQAGFGILKRSGTPEPWIKRLADDGTSYCYVNKIDGRVTWTRPSVSTMSASGVAPTVASTNELSLLSNTYGHLSETGDAYFSSQRLRSNSTTSQQKASSASSRRLSVYSDDSEVQPPVLKQSTKLYEHDTTFYEQGPGDWSKVEAMIPDGVEEEPIEPTAAERNALALQEAIRPMDSETVDVLADVAYAAIDAVIRSIDNDDTSSDQDQATEVENLVSAVVESIRNLLYTSCTLSGPLPTHIEQNSFYHSTSPAATQQLQTYLKTSQRKVTATLSKLVLSARAAYF